MNKSLVFAGLLLTIPASLPIYAADEPTHIEKGHLSAAYYKATPDKNPNKSLRSIARLCQ